MTLLISIAVAVVLVFSLGYFAPNLPFNELLGGNFYQTVSIILAIAVSALLNMPMLYMMGGNSAYKKGEYKKACGKYKKAYRTKRLSPDMEIYTGYMLLKEGDKKTCEEIFEHVSQKKLSPRQKNSLDTNYAILLWKKGELDNAISLLKDVWDRENTVTVASSLGALMLVRAHITKDYDETLEFCEKTNEMFTYERTIMTNLGEAYYSVGENDKALKVFEELTDCGMTSPSAFYYYALSLIKHGDEDEAISMLEAAMRTKFSYLSTVSRKTVKEALDELKKREVWD